MRVVLAFDSLKGCLSSAQANAAAGIGVRQAQPEAEVVALPVSDGGEGWLAAWQAIQPEAWQVVQADVLDPLLRPIRAAYLRRHDLAVIEVARVVGLNLIPPDQRNPLTASTYGVGMLIRDALGAGCRHFIVGLGGSGTSDAGLGMLQALHQAPPAPLSTSAFDAACALAAQPLGADTPLATPASERSLGIATTLGTPTSGLSFTIATDVRNPLCGPAGAAAVFGPQKGATPAMVAELDRRARRLSVEAAHAMGFDRSAEPGAGAAGGLGYAFLQILGAECKAGADLLLDANGFDSLLDGADMVITGEGKADRQTLMGKLPMRIMQRARLHHTPTLLVAGQVADRDTLLQAGFADVAALNTRNLTLAEAMQPHVAQRLIAQAVAHLTASPKRPPHAL